VLAVKLSYSRHIAKGIIAAAGKRGKTRLIDGDKTPSGFDPVSDARPQSFAAAEMITCDECLRANPPTRTNCLYCGANLPAISSLTNVQQPKEPLAESLGAATLSSGFYVVLAPVQSAALTESALTESAAVLNLKTAEAQLAIRSGRPVPLARTNTIDHATAIVDRLAPLGVGVDVFREDTLNLELPITRIRALEFTGTGFAVTLPKGEGISRDWDDLVLIVTGRLVIKRIEVEERQRRGKAKPLDSRELFSDELAMDLYTESDEVGFRILSSSFDFSCLGKDKSVTAFENFTKLLSLLGRRASKVEVDDTYRSLRAVLGNIWPLEPQTSKGELRRSGARKVDVSTVTTIDNEIQFDRYSRLRQHMKMLELENDR
jgi:hypothetical protein